MTKKRTIIILGILVALLPSLGFPKGMRDTLLVLIGLAIAIIGFLLKRKIERVAMSAQNDTFTQNGAYRTDDASSEKNEDNKVSSI